MIIFLNVLKIMLFLNVINQKNLILMRKLYLLLLFYLTAVTTGTFAQTSTEQFETESNGSTSFTDNGVIFNIISHVNTYDIQAAYPGTGWSGTAIDNRYIDNSGTGNQSAGTSFSIKTTSNLFKVNRFWVYAAAANTTLGVAGTLTITGKLSGVTKFTQTKTTGFTSSIAVTNGYTLIDMTNLNGQNYSNIVIDQLQITAGGNFQYLGFDAFTWVKDSGVVAGSLSLTPSQTNVSCNGGSNGTATVSASGGTAPYTYSWSPSGGTAATATGLAAGTYTVTVTDAVNNTKTQSFTITEPTALVANAVSQTNVACNGAATGAATVSASGGTGPYTYSWSPSGGTAATATGLAAGTYTVTVTDANSCQTTKSFTITQPTALSVTTSQTNVACNGASNGSATVNVTGGTPAYTYSWAPSGGTAATATGLSAGTYTVTITDANNCQTTRSFTITQPTSAVSGTTVVTNVACNGGSTGAINLTPAGGTAPYTFNWGGGITTEDRTGLSAGTYTVVITDANGCTATVSRTVTQPTAMSSTTSQTNIACNGGSTGIATVNVSGGTAPYTYSWSPSGGTAATATGLSAGTYTVTVTDANGCTLTRTFTITQPTALSVTTSQTNVACNGGSNGSATVNVTGGTPAYTYSWSPSGGTAATATGLSAGTYTVTITDANNCQTTRSFTITQPTSAVSGTTVVTNVACNGGSTGAINLTPAGGTAPYTFNWGGGITTEDRTGLSAGIYTVVITDANGCTATVSRTVTQPTAMSSTTSQTNIACNGGSTGIATVNVSGGTAPYTYSWSPSGGTAATATGLSAGTYTVTVTDANGCTLTRTFTITQPTALSVTTSQTNVACNGGSNGSASVAVTGGAGAYTYSWSPSGGTAATATGLSAGTYTVTITDANNCQTTRSFTITQPTSAVSGTTVVTNVACNGGSTGAINLTPAGGTAPYTFNWGGGITTEDRTGLSAGTYTVVITDANGCTATVSRTVTQPTAMSSTTSQTNIACNGGSTGIATVNVSGGTAPYTYSWSPSGGTAATATGLSAGTYTVTVTDANGCTLTRTFTITQPTALSVTTSQTNVACNGGSNGSASVAVTGGAGAYTYSWSPSGGTAATATGLSAGTYTVTITDANNCQTTKSFTITQPTALSVTTSQTNVSCNGSATGSASVVVSGGTGAYTYSWSPSGGTAATATGLVAGIYTVTITDANNCQTTKTFTITQPAAVSAPTGATSQTFNAGENLSVLVVNGQNIKWYASASNAANHINVLPVSTLLVTNTTYYATQTLNGCESTASLAVKVTDITLGVNQVEKRNKIQLYPNPVNDILQFSGEDKISKIVIFSLDGKKIMEKSMNEERKLNVRHLVEGNYIINIFTDKGVQTIKFIKH